MTHRDDHSDAVFGDNESRRDFPNEFTDASVMYRIHPELRDLIVDRDWPAHVDSYIARRLPQLGLRVVSFRDVTLLVVTWPHTALDAGSIRDLLEAWSLALAGKMDLIKPVLGAREDMAWNLAGKFLDDQLQPDFFKDRALSGFSYFLFLLRFVWRMLTDRNHDKRVFLLPRAVLQRWRESGAQGIPIDAATGKPTFISDADLIAAWQVKLTAALLNRRTRCCVVGSINARPLLSRANSEDGVYLQNLIELSHCSVLPDEAAGSFACVALAIRRELNQQLTEDQMIHHFRRVRQEREAGMGGGLPNFFCQRNDTVVMCNNLSGLRIASAIDFGPAVLAGADEGCSSGAVVNHVYTNVKIPGYVRPLFVIMDQNKAGYVISCDTPQTVWTMIEDEIGVGTAQK
ncbi:hypothetical protein NLG97_g6311 [Lecanicillium saksenae]|uniref:Uncharacterized protein n=1 Tax=Lecanicillium saksenae TaxID=468837 RepID=A0ACC1QQ05_9HYPO|nr:hypothetical protein NLG97_g6311 [Lecanicillium saksenae]